MKKLFLVMAMLAIVLSACGGRDMSNVKTSLYGHWEDEESGTEYYISDGSFIQVDEEGKEEKTYKVLEHDEVKNMIQIREKDKEGSGFIKEIAFDNDKRESVEVTIFADTYESGNNPGNSEINGIVEKAVNNIVAGKTFVEKWKYIDDKQKP